jgi:hypothetical protein
MGEQKNCKLLKVFAGIFILLGCVATPVDFLWNFQLGSVINIELAWMVFGGAVIGVSIYLACYSLNRMLFNIDHIPEQYVVPELEFFFRIVTAAYCGFAFIVPNLLKIVIPCLSMLQGISIVIFVHAMGLLPAVLFNIIKTKAIDK